MLVRSLAKTAAGTALCGAAFLGAVLLSSDRGPHFAPQTFQGTLIAAGGNGGAGNTSPGNKTFSISGTVVDLYPGAHKTLTLRFDNSLNQAIRISTTDVIVVSTDKANCPTAAVTPTNYRPAAGTGVVVAKNSSTTINLPISMIDSPASSCSGATFSLAYSGTAVQA